MYIQKTTLALPVFAVFFISMSHAAEVAQPKNARFKEAVYGVMKKSYEEKLHQSRLFQRYSNAWGITPVVVVLEGGVLAWKQEFMRFEKEQRELLAKIERCDKLIGQLKYE